MTDLFTNEEFRPEKAPKHTRVFAFCVDYLILMVILFILYGKSKPQQGQGIYIGVDLVDANGFVSFLLWLAIFPLMEGLTGQTLGKRAFRAKVLSDDYSKGKLLAVYRQAFI